MTQDLANEDTFTLSFPLDRPHLGLPMGNGNLGILVWGDNNILRLTVNRADHWDHRFGEQVLPGQNYREMVDSFDPDNGEVTQKSFVRRKFTGAPKDIPWRSTRLPAGRVDINLHEDELLEKIKLDYSSGMVVISTATGRILRLMLSRTECRLLIEDSTGLIDGVDVHPAWDYVGEILQKAGFKPPQVLRQKETQGWFQDLPEDSGLMVLCEKTSYGRAVTLELENEPVWNFPTADWEQTCRENSSCWQSFWSNTCHLNLPDEFFNRYFRFALYKFFCATSPGGTACGLQGPWVEEYQKTPWSGDYHFNVNIQQIYTLGFSIGAYENLLPLFDMLESESFQCVMQENARNLFGIDDGLLLTHAVDDRGFQCGDIKTGAVLDFACGGWTAQLYWLYYQHTLDREFLEKRAMPFMRGVMRVFEAALEEYEDRLSLPMAVSAEYGCSFPLEKNGKLIWQDCGRDPSNQLMCAHMLADALLQSCIILDIPADPIWSDIKQRLPRYTLGGKSGKERIFIWEGQDLDVCHRHHSHLAGIYPFFTLDCPSEEEQRIIDNTVDHWILKGMGEWSEWCYPWAAIIQARLGFRDTPIQLLKIWKELFLNSSWASVYLPNFRGLCALRKDDLKKPRQTSEIMQLDGAMAAATALLEMLVHRRGDTVYLFSGVPESWQNVSFENVRLPGGLSVSAKLDNGELGSVKITSKTSGSINVSCMNKIKSCKVQREAKTRANTSRQAMSYNNSESRRNHCFS